MAYKMGVREHLHSYPAEALGGLTVGVSPLEMADVYATLADGGYRNTPIAITKVVFPGGQVDTNWGKPHRVKALSDGVTSEETNILHQNVLGGTATRSAIACPTAAKTGHHQRPQGRMARRLHTQLLDRGVDGLPQQEHPDDRRSRRAPAGRLSAGGNLACLYGRGHRRRSLAPNSPRPTEPISYQPFFGKYCLDRDASGSKEGFESEESTNAFQKASRAKNISRPAKNTATGGPAAESPRATPSPQSARTGRTGADPDRQSSNSAGWRRRGHRTAWTLTSLAVIRRAVWPACPSRPGTWNARHATRGAGSLTVHTSTQGRAA